MLTNINNSPRRVVINVLADNKTLWGTRNPWIKRNRRE